MNAPQGKEADHGCRFSSRGGRRSSAGRVALRLPVVRGSYPPGLRCGKMVLARLDLFSGRRAVGVSVAMLESRSFVHRGRGPAHRLAIVVRTEAVFRRHRRLLHGARENPRGSVLDVGARDGPARGERRAGRLALAGASRALRRRFDDHHAGHAGESSRVIRSRPVNVPVAAFRSCGSSSRSRSPRGRC